MSNLEKLEKDIRKLGRQELAVLREWFRNYDADEWDRQMEADVSCGKLDSLAKEALEAYKSGNTKEI
jgi:hypothetical protein